MGIWHLMSFKEILRGIIIPLLGALMLGVYFLAPGSIKDVLLAVGGAFVGQITIFYDDYIKLKNKVSEATKKGRAAFLLGCDLAPFLSLSEKFDMTDEVMIKAYRHIETELEVLGLSTTGALLSLLKETVGRPLDKVQKSRVDLIVNSITEILASIQPPLLNYIFHIGLKLTGGTIVLAHGMKEDGESALQALEDYNKKIINNKLYSNLYKEVVGRAIEIFREEIDEFRDKGKLDIPTVKKVSDFIEEVRIPLHPS
jgi:hypothetical protein